VSVGEWGLGWQSLQGTTVDRREGRRLLRRGRGNPIRVCRATIIMASASGTLVPAIARVVAASEDTVRDVIHAFKDRGPTALDPQRARRDAVISDAETAVIVRTAPHDPASWAAPSHIAANPGCQCGRVRWQTPGERDQRRRMVAKAILA